MIYNEARRSWYAHIPVEVDNIPETKGDLRASVDLGIVNLATVYVEDGTWYIFKGGSVLSQYECYSEKISKVPTYPRVPGIQEQGATPGEG